MGTMLVGSMACDGKGELEDTAAEFTDGSESELPSADWGSDTATPDLTATDSDWDGTPDADDCDPDNPEVHPDAEEIAYDGVDNDCDETTPDDDLDGDGYGIDDDCDDLDASVFGDDCDGVLEPGGFVDLDGGPGVQGLDEQVGDDEEGEDDAQHGDDDAGWDTGWDLASDKLTGRVELTGGACGCSSGAPANGGATLALALCLGLFRRKRSP
jgi:MYXO-CTERM domain-containing protein